MKSLAWFVRGALSAGILGVIVAGCNGSQTQNTGLFPGQPNGSSAELKRLGVGSSMTAESQSSDLLYAADAKDGSVYAYSFPEGKPQGRLFDVRASALCTAKNGDVFAVTGEAILRFAHGGTRPIASLQNPLQSARGCAVDPSSGTLAVSGATATTSSIAIFAGGKGVPKIYPSRNGMAFGAVAYDRDGNLYAATAAADIAELTRGGQRFVTVDLGAGRPSQVDAIGWDGKALAVAGGGTIFRYTLTGAQALPAGRTTFKGAATVTQFAIRNGKIAVPGAAGIAMYAYPAAGSPLRVIKAMRNASAVAISRAAGSAFAVTTYHYDNLRTGWNNHETTLTYGNVNPSSFGLLHSIALDDQVDVQPLVVPNVTTTHGTASGSTHEVVYVATEHNTIYAIDTSSGAILFQRNLGNPVPMPLGCNNNGPYVGINGTPVIDLAAGVMYAITYTLEGSTPTYRIHELNLSDLSDVVPSVVVSASHQLTNGNTYNFQAAYQRQRPGLLEANGNIYAGFGSFCDYSASISRGWLLGWQAGSLTPLAANRLNDTQATSPNEFFLSAIWMSGYGLAADPSGNVYFVTGNSDYSGNTYDGITNIQESVVKVSADLTQVLSLFTPSNVGYLDRTDEDLGSGGVMLLPALTSTPLAAAAGKTGTMFLLNQNNLGGYVAGGPNNDLAEVSVGGCWCGPSYFAVNGKKQRIVGSGGSTLTLWNVKDKSKIRLTLAGSKGLPSGQDGGFLTSVSSNARGHNPIIWALARPQYVPGPLTLVALAANESHGTSPLTTLYQAPAGYWIEDNANANLLPAVANGKVYVASYQQLEIFGLGGSAAVTRSHARRVANVGPIKTPNEVTGTLLTVNGARLTLRTRDGRLVTVDAAAALKNERTGDLVVGKPFNVRGTYDSAGVMHAAAIVRAKPSRSNWPPDR